MRVPLKRTVDAAGSCSRPACCSVAGAGRRWRCSSRRPPAARQRPRRRRARCSISPTQRHDHRRCGTVNAQGRRPTRCPTPGNPFLEQLHAPACNGAPRHLRQHGHHLRQPAAVVHRRPASALRPDLLELPRQRGQRRRPRRAGHHRAEPAGRGRGHGRLLGDHRPHAGRRRQGGRGRAQAARLTPSRRSSSRPGSTRSTPPCPPCPPRT